VLEEWEPLEIDTGETVIFARRKGDGPPLLLLHGPETHLMWRSVGPRLALWRPWRSDVRGGVVVGGHFFHEEAPAVTADALRRFLL
jgi:pimeloyl-ACP methyl ester carboxylesterase